MYSEAKLEECFTTKVRLQGQNVQVMLFHGLVVSDSAHSCTDVLKMVYCEILPYFENYFHTIIRKEFRTFSGILFLHY